MGDIRSFGNYDRTSLADYNSIVFNEEESGFPIPRNQLGAHLSGSSSYSVSKGHVLPECIGTQMSGPDRTSRAEGRTGYMGTKSTYLLLRKPLRHQSAIPYTAVEKGTVGLGFDALEES